MFRLSLLLTFIAGSYSCWFSPHPCPFHPWQDSYGNWLMDKGDKIPSASFLSVIRSDPKALLNIFETATADKDKVTTIINLLENLVTEGNTEISIINRNIISAKNNTAKAKQAYLSAVGVEKTLLTVYNDAKKATAAARGRLAAVQKIHDAESPALKKEIEVFGKVLRILNSLLNGNDLVEEDTEQVKAFISVADQADPVKVQRIIDIVNRLDKASKDELNTLESNVKAAEAVVAGCVVAENKAKGAWEAAKLNSADKKKVWDFASGREAIIERNGKARITIVKDEISTLRSVIALLAPLLK